MSQVSKMTEEWLGSWEQSSSPCPASLLSGLDGENKHCVRQECGKDWWRIWWVS